MAAPRVELVSACATQAAHLSRICCPSFAVFVHAANYIVLIFLVLLFSLLFLLLLLFRLFVFVTSVNNGCVIGGDL